jgi:PAS domain S-box-containing protein
MYGKAMPDISGIRPKILLLIAGAVITALVVLILVTPAVFRLPSQATREAQNNFVVLASILMVLLLAISYRYLQPIGQVGHYLNRGQAVPSDLAQQARTCAFSAPFYLFFALVLLAGLIPVLINLYRLITRPGYIFVTHLSYALLVVATSIAIALTISSLSRRILRPVLVATADLAQDVGRRYEIRLRLATIVLSLIFVVFCFVGVFAFNQVYQTAQESSADRFRQWGYDVAQVAPHLDDGTLVTLVAGSDILTEYQATPVLTDSNGRYLIAPPAAQPLPNSSDEFLSRIRTGEVVEVELIEKEGHFTLMLPLQRDNDTWHLSVTYTFTPENVSIVRRTLLILAGLGVASLGLTLAVIHYLADDITRDLKYVTTRLLDTARQGQVGKKVPTLSLDEVGDLVAAFEQVRKVMLQQQDELNQHIHQMQQLHQASLALTSSVDFEQVLERICQVAQDITTSDAVMLFLYDAYDDSFVRASQVGDEALFGPANHGRPQGMTRVVLNSRRATLVQDTLNHPMVNSWIVERGIRSVIATPVISRAQAMGVLYVASRRANAYHQEDLQVVSALASQAATAIENARLLEETMSNAQTLEQRARKLWMINRISADLTSYLDPYEIFNATARHLIELMDVDHCSVSIFNPGAPEGVIVAEYPEIGTAGLRLPRKGNPAIEQVLTTKKPLVVSDVLPDPEMAPVREALAEVGIRATFILPLVARDEVMGIIRLDSLYESHEFESEDQKLCSTIAAQAATAASNARLLYDLQQQSRALSRKSQELAEESAKLDAVLTNMADGLVVTDLVGRIMVSNPAFETIAGLPPGRSLRGRLLNQVFSQATLRQVIAEATDAPDKIAVADLELPDGRVLRATASALHMKQEADPLLAGQMTGVVTVLRDITHEVEVDRIKTEFISAVSHELRTPLTSILGFANLIQREFRRRIVSLAAGDVKTRRAADRILENLAIIEAESQRLTQLINDLLDIAKIEAGRIEWHMGAVNIADVIQSSVNATAILAQEKDLALKIALPTKLPPVWSDQDRLIQVMTNLLSNAIKFTDEGEIIVSGWVWSGEPSSLPSPPALQDIRPPVLIVSVADTGVGIAQEDIPLVFERFRQVGDTLTEKPKGTGLGLSICKEIIEHQGGVIWTESALGVGSTFYFTLPVSPAESGAATTLRSTDPQELVTVPVAADLSPRRELELADNTRPDRCPTGEPVKTPIATVTNPARTKRHGAAGGRSPRRGTDDANLILVVDDEPNIRQLLRLELTDAGYDVIEARDGDTALIQARLTHPDLIILDVLMPGVSGFGVVGALRTDPDTTHIPIIILSVAEEAKRALELGATACLTKPVDVPHLLNTVEQLLQSPGPVS